MSNVNIAVLGRGPSLARYKEFYHLFDKIYIVNDFNVEIDYLGVEYFENKKIVHICGRSKIGLLSPNNYRRLGITSVQSNTFSKKDAVKLKSDLQFLKVNLLSSIWEKRGYPPVKWEKAVQHIEECGYNELCELLETTCAKHIRKEKNRKNAKVLRGWPTTGLLAIDFALVDTTPENIYLFGFDFYDGDYLVKKNPYEHQTYEWDKSKMMRYHLKHLIEEFSDTHFHSSHSLDWDYDNWSNL